jgi:hypothetical protein
MVAGALMTSACSTASVFNSYTEYMNPKIKVVAENPDEVRRFNETQKSAAVDTTIDAEAKEVQPVEEAQAVPVSKEVKQVMEVFDELDGKRDDSDRIVYLMERGHMAQWCGDVDASIKDYSDLLSEFYQEEENKASVTLSEAGAQVSSALLNDNAIPYTGYGYERVFVNYYQARNYLLKNNLEGAGVEARKATERQDIERKRHEEEIKRAKQKEAKEKADGEKKALIEKYSGSLVGAIGQAPELQGVDEVAGKVSSSFQNALALYLSGVIAEIQGDNNEAYRQFSAALSMFPKNKYLKRDLTRIVIKQGDRNELASLVKSYGNAFVAGVKKDLKKYGKEGEVIVFYEDGLVPQRQEAKLSVPTENGILSMAFPYYRKEKWTSSKPLSVSMGDKVVGTTEPVVYVRSLAAKALKEGEGARTFRAILRLIAKAVAQKVAKDKMGTIGVIASSVFNVASESADVRTWLTLPSDVHILRRLFPAGAHTLTLSHPDAVAPVQVAVDIAPGEPTFVFVERPMSKLVAKAVTLGSAKNKVAQLTGGAK